MIKLSCSEKSKTKKIKKKCLDIGRKFKEKSFDEPSKQTDHPHVPKNPKALIVRTLAVGTEDRGLLIHLGVKVQNAS